MGHGVKQRSTALKPVVIEIIESNPKRAGKCRVGIHTRLKAILRANRRGERRGVYAVCTVNRLAIQEALRQARRAPSI